MLIHVDGKSYDRDEPFRRVRPLVAFGAWQLSEVVAPARVEEPEVPGLGFASRWQAIT